MSSPLKRYFSLLKRETHLPWCENKVIPPTESQMGWSPTDDASAKSEKLTSPAAVGIPVDSPQLTGNLSQEELQPRTPKRKGWGKYWSIIACGTGLFSDGYINNSVGFFNTMVKQIYGADIYSNSIAMSNISALLFVGTVVGMVFFGFLSDHKSRKLSMVISTVILILFSILVAGAWGVGMPKNPHGMFAAMAVYRTILGIGIGGEYPAGSVATAEASQLITRGHRNRWFVWFTNYMIDSGFVAAAFIAWVLLYICGVGTTPTSTHGLQTAWRVLFGLGAICPTVLLWMRVKFEENEQFVQNNLKRVRTPYWLILKEYGPRLAIVSLIWFLYDFLAYSWGIYSSQIIQLVVTDGNLKTTFGWNVLLNVFYLPGSFLGAFAADYLGPRLTLMSGTLLQGIIGFILVSQYDSLIKHVGPFVVAYGIFITLGEFGPGDNIGLIASKTSPSAIRGRYYGIAAAIGKLGAFVGGYAFPAIAKHYGGLDTKRGQETLLYVSSALCVFSALLALLLPPLTQDAVNNEDIRFRKVLEKHGYDTSKLGDEIPALGPPA